MCSCVLLRHWLHIRTGKFILCLKAHGSCNQVQNNYTGNEFNYDLHILSLIRVTISHGLLRWKLEMHMVDKNTSYTLYLFILSSIIKYLIPIYSGWGRGKKQILSHVFPHHLETPQAICKAENSMTLKIHLEYVRICVSQHILYIWP